MNQHVRRKIKSIVFRLLEATEAESSDPSKSVEKSKIIQTNDGTSFKVITGETNSSYAIDTTARMDRTEEAFMEKLHKIIGKTVVVKRLSPNELMFAVWTKPKIRVYSNKDDRIGIRMSIDEKKVMNDRRMDGKFFNLIDVLKWLELNYKKNKPVNKKK